ncbi:MAG: ATP-binding cassette domain-containing protein, partial [Clostridium sp.]|nr:ATP-binding cassette domain-containing protein [Clostridium sp.]
MEDVNLNKEEKEIAIKLRGITKTFGTVVANDQVNLDINYGEILALLGENGSGKTTLMNMLSGIYFPDGGTMEMDGKEVMVSSPLKAIDLGICMIHQHFKLVEVFNALDNIFMG